MCGVISRQQQDLKGPIRSLNIYDDGVESAFLSIGNTTDLKNLGCGDDPLP
jgi:hypothetical protein